MCECDLSFMIVSTALLYRLRPPGGSRPLGRVPVSPAGSASAACADDGAAVRPRRGAGNPGTLALYDRAALQTIDSAAASAGPRCEGGHTRPARRPDEQRCPHLALPHGGWLLGGDALPAPGAACAAKKAARCRWHWEDSTVYVFALVAWVGGERHGLEKSHAFSRKVWQCTIRISRSGGGGTTGWAALVQAHGPQGASFNTAWQQGHGWCARCSMVACSRGRRRQRQRRRRGQAPPATTTGGAGAQSTGWPKCLLAGRGVGGMDRPPQRSSGWGGRRECGWGVGA